MPGMWWFQKTVWTDTIIYWHNIGAETLSSGTYHQRDGFCALVWRSRFWGMSAAIGIRYSREQFTMGLVALLKRRSLWLGPSLKWLGWYGEVHGNELAFILVKWRQVRTGQESREAYFCKCTLYICINLLHDLVLGRSTPNPIMGWGRKWTFILAWAQNPRCTLFLVWNRLIVS